MPERRETVMTNSVRSIELSTNLASAFCATFERRHAKWTTTIRRPLPARPPSIGGAAAHDSLTTSSTPAIGSGTAGFNSAPPSESVSQESQSQL
jgi:hypothetical protein